jgi:hypothetical protein
MTPREHAEQLKNKTPTQNNLPEIDSLSVLLKGEMFMAHKLDGTTEEVKIHDLPLSQMAQLAACYNDEAALVELYCRKEKGFAETVDREDCVAIAAIGDKRTADFFDRWWKRQTKRLDTILPGTTDSLKNKIGSALASGLPA